MARIVYVEHDDLVRTTLTRGLERAGHVVEAHSSVQGAMVGPGLETADLLLLGSVGDADLLIRNTWGPPNRPRILVLTNDPMERLVADALGVDRTVAKPVTIRDLAGQIHELLSETDQGPAEPPARA